jgi:signal transduction histidine kinase
MAPPDRQHATVADLVDRLASHRTLAAAPRAELEWLAAHGTLRRLAEGAPVAQRDVPIPGLYVVLSGLFAIFLDHGAGRRKVMEWRAGDVAGMLPYSRLVTPPGDSFALEPSEILVVPREHFAAMIRECHQVTTILVHNMLDRARFFTSTGLQEEKLASLGKLAARLAHELNNPVAAIERSASLLEDRLNDAAQASGALMAAKLTDAQIAAIDGLQNSCLIAPLRAVRSPIQQAEREDAIAGWLDDHGVNASIAGPLAETAVTLDALDGVAKVVTGPPLDAVLRSVAAGCSVRSIASEIQEAATRIAGLVTAVKGFTHMDQARVAEPVDLTNSLGYTVAILNAKARSKSIALGVTVEPGLPRARGFAGELNQIWANLIDNALDAAPRHGRVDVTANHEHQRLVVRVIDNGPGIPPNVRQHLFEPFFTTKPVGQGTGLGLDIVRRLIIHNDAEIEVDSVPGRTEFRVSLPLAEPAPAGKHP